MSYMFYLLLGAAVLKLSDLRLHWLNRDFLLKHGAKEVRSTLPKLYIVAEWGLLVSIAVELIVRSEPVAAWQIYAGSVVMILAVAVRLWARQLLGRMWNLGLLYIPGVAAVRHGPYRFFAHPEYVARVVEALSLAACAGAYLSMGIYVGSCLILLPRIVLLERRQMKLLST